MEEEEDSLSDTMETDETLTSQCVNEEDVLPPKDEDDDSDSWHEFSLTQVTIYNQCLLEHANLLEAELDGPLVVRGYLNLEDDQECLGMSCSDVISSLLLTSSALS